MKTWIVLIAVVLAGAGVAFFYGALLPSVPEPETVVPSKPAGPPPKLELVEAKSYQFGTIPVGGKRTHAWSFRNVGEGPLDIWLEDTTCSCTVASLKAAKGQEKTITIAPGQSSPLEVSWEGRHAGRFHQAATIGTNDPDNPSVVLTLIGTVLDPLEIRPSDSVSFPDGTPDQSRSAWVRILSNDRPDVKLLRVSTSKPGLIVAEAKPMSPEELAKEKGKSGYDLSIEVRPGMPPGRFLEEVSIESDHPARPALKIHLSGNTVGPITLTPARVVMPSVPRATGASVSLSLVVRGEQPVRFEIASKPEILKVEITPETGPDASGRFRMTVTVPPGLPVGAIDRPILLKTNHPRLPEIRVPVSIYVSNRKEAG